MSESLMVDVSQPISREIVQKALQAAADAFAVTLGAVPGANVQDFSVERPTSSSEARLELALGEVWSLFAQVTRDAWIHGPGRNEPMLRVRGLLDELHAIAADCRTRRNAWIDEHIRKRATAT